MRRAVAAGWSGAVVVGAAVLLVWSPSPNDGDAEGGMEPRTTEYRGVFRPLVSAPVRGRVTVRRSGDRLAIRIDVRGLPRGEIGQQLHGGKRCEDSELGPVTVHLDERLDETGSLLGGPFPRARTRRGRLLYEETSTSSAFRELDLAHSTVVLRAGMPGLPVACAELRETSGSSYGDLGPAAVGSILALRPAARYLTSHGRFVGRRYSYAGSLR